MPATALKERLIIRREEEQREGEKITPSLIAYIRPNPSDYCSMWHVSGVVTDHTGTLMDSK